ncbi:GDP-mannose 4,6-dehydratase [Fictibacillus nanhaiensis]|uniref:NAD-dependent epimerase/dehydratase family protein n=1 Tax=Fictibacillus nanhaiensis TaxID=742169 RepID=UPI001C988529|nr:GDP-mannose 4,6-dehydratase [Fictibacillus nanhaiensis]
MNILVTGGAGFIGSQLLRSLNENKKLHIISIDSFHGYYSRQRKMDQLKMAGDGFEFIELDLLEEKRVIQLFEQKQFHTVIHLAAIPGVPKSIENPHEYIDLDIKATVNILKASGLTKVEHVIFASSSSVYGNQGYHPVKESDARGFVASPYAASKWSAESFCHAYRHLYGYHLSILRFFTVYGPWGRPDMAIPLFVKKLLNDEPLTIFSKKTARDYTYVDDIIRGIQSVIQHPNGHQVYNLGSGNPVTIEELVETFRLFFPQFETIHFPHRLGDVQTTWADIKKANEELDYQPSISFAEGIGRTIEWAKRYERF